MGAVRQYNMETKLWIIALTVSAMASVSTQLDLSSVMGMGNPFSKADKLTTTPAPMQEYGQGFEQHNPGPFQKPQKDLFKLNKFEATKQELKFDPLKFEKEKDKFFKNDKFQNNMTHTPIALAAPVENPTYSTYIPSMNYPPTVDDGSYSSPHPYPQYHRPQFRGPYRGQGYNHNNVSAVAFDLYRKMYGYNNKGPAQAPNAPVYAPPNIPLYGPPPIQPPGAQYGPPPGHQYSPPPGPQYGQPQYGNIPYGPQGPPMGPPVVVPHEGGYHEEPRPYHGPTIDHYHQPYAQGYSQNVDYSKYINPVPYSEVSEYLSPAQYNDYTGMLYSAYNIPPPSPPTSHYQSNYTTHRIGGYNNNNHDFKMVVAVVVLDGSHDYRSKATIKDFGKGVSSIQGTLFISEIYPSVCLVSGVVTGMSQLLTVLLIITVGTGLPPNYKFGIAIHSFGDLTNGCVSIGGHFNPENRTHGNINAPQSHAGDLGNLRSDPAGVAFVNKISRNRFSIQNRNSVAGRSVGICEKQDDLGMGGNIASLRDGNCGQILACGIIGLANTGAPASNSGHY